MSTYSFFKHTCLLVIFSSLFAVSGRAYSQQLSVEDARGAQVDVWVDNAPLNLFFEQLAQMTGRVAEVQDGLPGEISGRYNGSMADTLGAVHSQFPVLIFLDDKTLGIVGEEQLVSATILTGEGVLDPETASDLIAGLLPGNSVDVRAGEVLVRGHPTFVNQMASKLASTIREIERAQNDASATISSVAKLANEPRIPLANKDTGDSEGGEKALVIRRTNTKRYLWVTDIPGFDTF